MKAYGRNGYIAPVVKRALDVGERSCSLPQCADHLQLSDALSSSEVDCCHAVRHETVLQSFNVFYGFRKSLYTIKMVLCLLVFCVFIGGVV
jgi:hypothetical protein